MHRRSVLAGLVAAAFVAPLKATAGYFGKFMAGGGSGGGGGGFTPTFQAIDGGPTYYASNSFTAPANAGFDSKIEIGCWPSYLQGTTEYQFFQNVGVNFAMLITSDSDRSLAGSTYGVYWGPALFGDDSIKTNFFASTPGAETIILNVNDENTFGDWQSCNGLPMRGDNGNLSNKANGYFSFPTGAPPNPGDTITLNGTVVTFVASGATGNQININAAGIFETLDNAVTMLNASADTEIVKCYYQRGGVFLWITFKTAGTGGNSFTLAINSPVTGGGRSASTLTNGMTINQSIDVGRPFWTNFTYGTWKAPLLQTPNPFTCANQYAATTTAPSGATRHIELQSIDFYWISASSDPIALCGCLGGAGELYYTGGTDSAANAYNKTTSSISVPTSFPTTIGPFNVTRADGVTINKNFAVGAPVLLTRGTPGVNFAAILGQIATYNSTTGAMTVDVAGSHTYTATQNAGVNTFLGSTAEFTISGINHFANTQGGFNPVITNLTSAGRIPGGTTLSAVDAFGTTAAGTNTEWEFRCSQNTTVQAGDVVSLTTTDTTGGTGPFTDFSVHVGMTPDQCRRVMHYGNVIDSLRGYQYNANPAPINNFLEVAGAYQNCQTLADYPTPAELNGMAWQSIMHGGLRLGWFNASYGGPLRAGGNNQKCMQDAYCLAIQSPNTIAVTDQIRATNFCIQSFERVIRSQWVTNYATISPNGFICPFPTSYVQNNTSVDSVPTCLNRDLAMVNGAGADSFEVGSKRYTGSTTGRILVQNAYYVFAGYRGSNNGGSAINKVATITIPNTGATTVTKFYADGVIGAAASGGNTRVQCGSTAQIASGDTVTISGTAGVTGLNATFTNITVVDATHFDVALGFTGSLTTKGVAIFEHTINITGGGTQFQDTFVYGTDIGIYRIN